MKLPPQRVRNFGQLARGRLVGLGEATRQDRTISVSKIRKRTVGENYKSPRRRLAIDCAISTFRHSLEVVVARDTGFSEFLAIP